MHPNIVYYFYFYCIVVEGESGVTIPELSDKEGRQKRESIFLSLLSTVISAMFFFSFLSFNFFSVIIFSLLSGIMYFYLNEALLETVKAGAAYVASAASSPAAAAAGGGRGEGLATSAPTATAVKMSPTLVGAGGEAEAKSTFSISTTTTQVTAPVGVFASARNAITGMTQGLSASPADGAYSALSSDESVHGHHPSMAVVTGVPVSSPITAQQQGTTHWI